MKSSLIRSTAIAALLGLAAATAAQAQTIPSDAAPNCPVSAGEEQPAAAVETIGSRRRLGRGAMDERVLRADRG